MGWAREVATTIADHAKGYESKLIGKRVLLKALKSQGRIIYGCGGVGGSGDAGDFTWRVPYRQAQLRTGEMENGMTPARQDRYKVAGLSYIDYTLSDFMTKKEKLRNQGRGQIINYFQEMSDGLLNDAGDQFSKELYVDSSATGNSQRISGIETMMAINGTMDVSLTTATSRAANAGDVAAYPSDTYAGLSTILANYGGSWTVGTAGIAYQWPAGRGDMQFDFFSPIIVNYTSTLWGGSSATWAYNAEKATRYLATHMGRYQSNRESLQTIMLDRELYRQFMDLYAGKERIVVTESPKMRALGFDGVLMDGVTVTWELDIPGGVGYGWDVDNMQLRSCQDTLFNTEGPWFEKLQRAYVVAVDFCGQLKMKSPRFFGKLQAIA